MTENQRMKALEIVSLQTLVSDAEAEQYDDLSLSAWLYELGYDWDGTEWVEADIDDDYAEA